jgi:hypothetical protein
MERILERTIAFTFAVILVGVIISLLIWFLERQKLTLTHLGSGSFMTSSTEEPIFEYIRAEPFTFSGYVNMKNLEDGDEIIIREYVKLGVDEDYTLYFEEPIHNKQKEPLYHIEKLPALKAIKVTIQQTKGTPKYVPWEFFGSVVA